MKKQILLSLLVLGSACAIAQPTLTGTTNNPVLGDNFTYYNCATAGVVQGASGPGVTWDFHTLTGAAAGMLSTATCASTPYCDSFPPNDIVIQYIDPGVDTEYDYCTTNGSAFDIIGVYDAGANFTHFQQPDIILKYPATYNATYQDTSISIDYASLPLDYVISRSSRTVDGYGTLILPSGTHANVLRVHQTTIMLDSFPGMAPMFSMYSENYSWFAAGFHMFLLEMDLDSSAGPALSVSNVTYLSGATTGITSIDNDQLSLTLSPNPTSGILNIKLSLDAIQNPSISITDISGKLLANINTSGLTEGENKIQYSVAGLPAGLYLVHFTDDTHNITRKVVVSN